MFQQKKKTTLTVQVTILLTINHTKDKNQIKKQNLNKGTE